MNAHYRSAGARHMYVSKDKLRQNFAYVLAVFFSFFSCRLDPRPLSACKCAFTAHIAYSACSHMLQVRICCNTAYCKCALTAYIAYSACSHMLQVRICCNTAYCKCAFTAYIACSSRLHMLQMHISSNTSYCYAHDKCECTVGLLFCRQLEMPLEAAGAI